MSLPPRIAIIGAGPGGLLLARMLHRKGITPCVFEREVRNGARQQGGTLDLHLETGQAALKRAGLFEAFRERARYGDQDLRQYDKSGALVAEKAGVDGDKPEIDRGHLRDLLLGSVPSGVVQWGRQLEAVTPRNDGSFHLGFADGTAEDVDFVVGADGAWSKVRPLLSSATPKFTGSILYEMSIDDVDVRHPAIGQFVGQGMALIEGDRKVVIAQRNANGNIRVYAGFAQQSGDGDDTRWTKEAPPKSHIASFFAGWSGMVLALFAAADEAVRPWPIYALPVGHRWEPRAGLTLIGDAAHLMPPAGEGANLPLLDAADLADALMEPEGQGAAVARFEEAMFERAGTAAARAMAMLSDGIDMPVEAS